ncbi:hypothetical protein L873DRAFT_1810876 [Choiromyces venosus 120613-1]|uniref:Uncharacterized protein n=1 Tax=Choiromyces venosus 120613-1 TaxID=1336337 RepID=A0A3N4JEW4_9PEZI|nr:hypothetical protein L873DRAFT_1810876 [Choiromyces venosus 120613-1]
MIQEPTFYAARHKIKQNLNEQNNQPKYLMPKGIRYDGETKQQTIKPPIPYADWHRV